MADDVAMAGSEYVAAGEAPLRKFAIVTGASSGIGLELARIAATENFELLIVADEPEIHDAADALGAQGAQVESIEADLSTLEGVNEVISATDGRPIDALFANAGRGHGGAFLDQPVDDWRHTIDTNVTGTLYLAQQVASRMKQRGQGRILFTGSIAGHMPGPYGAVYNGTKAFINNFSYALREELKDSGVTVTCLMPGATETEFFERADMEDTKIGASENKDDPAKVARDGFDALMDGQGHVVSGIKNKMLVAAAHMTPDTLLAKQHAKTAEPGSAKE